MLILSAMLFQTAHIAAGMINAMVAECECGGGGGSGAHTGTLVAKVHPRGILLHPVPDIPSPPVQFKSFNCCQTLPE